MDSRIETLLKALLNGDSVEDFEPQSRAEAYLKSCILKEGVGDLPDPQSRLDALLYELAGIMPTLGSGDIQLQTKTAKPGVGEVIVKPDNGYALSKVTIEAVTSAIDANIKPENILDGVTILGVEGRNKGYDAGYEDGKLDERDMFWETFQKNGNRTDYSYTFRYDGWTPQNFNPKYPIKMVGPAVNVFERCYFTGQTTTSKDLIDTSNIIFNVEEATDASYIFANACVSSATLRFSDKLTKLYNAFTKGSGGEIPGMSITLLVPNENCDWTGAFSYHQIKSLKLLEGTKIGNNSFNIQWTRKALPVEDLKSILAALVEKSDGKSWFITVGSANYAVIEEYLSDELTQAIAKGWEIK